MRVEEVAKLKALGNALQPGPVPGRNVLGQIRRTD